MTLTANNLFQLEGQNPHMATLGEMGNISNLCQVGWHEWACFREGISHTLPQPNEKLGRYLGPANNERNDMLRWMLQQKW